MIFGRETPLVVPPRVSATPQVNTSRIALTAQQVSRIAHIFDPTIEEELEKARMAWTAYQSTRQRDAVYPYLSAVFEMVVRWKKQHRAKASAHQALIAANKTSEIKIDEPFTAVIFCTSDAGKLDVKTRSKWSRALRYAERFKPDTQDLAEFIKSKGGINECADQFSGCLGRAGW
jgi:hypothetical protein